MNQPVITSTKTESVVITLQMDLDTARRLMGLIQNPLSDYEDVATGQLRQSIWTALEQQGVQVF